MAEPTVRFLGAPMAPAEPKPGLAQRIREIPAAFFLVVVLPTLIAAIYYLLIASPRYVSEAKFIVRQANQDQPSALGVTLQSVGLSATQSDAFIVHTFLMSRDGLKFLRTRFNVASAWSLPGADVFSRHPRLWESNSEESWYGGYRRYVEVGYDSTTGVSTLRVQAFRARDAQQITQALLQGGEQLVNNLNQRATSDALAEAELTTAEAEARLLKVQGDLTAFRNRERFIDPAQTAEESSQLIGGLLSRLASLRAERAQTAAASPESPLLAPIDGQIRALAAQVEIERGTIAGGMDSLAPKVGIYEGLVLDRELADRALAAATAAEDRARLEARRQKLYLDRVVEPNLPDEPGRPNRWMAVLSVFATCLLFFGVGWLIWAGVRETRQG